MRVVSCEPTHTLSLFLCLCLAPCLALVLALSVCLSLVSLSFSFSACVWLRVWLWCWHCLSLSLFLSLSLCVRACVSACLPQCVPLSRSQFMLLQRIAYRSMLAYLPQLGLSFPPLSLFSLFLLMSTITQAPNIDDPAQAEAYTVYRQDKDSYNEKVKEQARKFAA